MRAQAVFEWCDEPHKQACTRRLLQALDERPGLTEKWRIDSTESTTRRRSSGILGALRQLPRVSGNAPRMSLLLQRKPRASCSVSSLAAAPMGASHQEPELAAAAQPSHDMASLPPALSRFTPLCQESAVQAALEELPALEKALVKEPQSEVAYTALAAGLGRVRGVLERRIDERTREAGIIGVCDRVVESGANHFLGVYVSVYQTIENTEDVQAHRVLAACLRRTMRSDEARQRTADIAELYRDAVLSAHGFGAVVRGVAERCHGATLEFTESKPKRTSRMLEKALLRRGEGHGRAERICDVVRCMIVVRNMRSLQEVLEDFLRLHMSGDVVVVRVKDRFETPSGDIPINAQPGAPGYGRAMNRIDVLQSRKM